MSEETIMEILREIQRADIRFGSCEARITFHDGRAVKYEITTRRSRNIVRNIADGREGGDENRA